MKAIQVQLHLQRQYYARSATQYDSLHVHRGDEHHFALAWMCACIDFLGCQSVLDVGSGTGRALAYLREHRPHLKVTGVEPSADLRKVGHARGLPQDTLVHGNAMDLGFADASFDLVCEFGVLHHVPTPRTAISEMLRVSRRAVFISDDNHFAAGTASARGVKRALAALKLWRPAYLLRTGGKGYRISESDGLSYPYSVFDDLAVLDTACESINCMNTRGRGPNLRSGASHVALLGVKHRAAKLPLRSMPAAAHEGT